MSSGPPKAVVYRRFEGQEKVCEQALRILLQKKGGPIAAPDARKEFNEPDRVLRHSPASSLPSTYRERANYSSSHTPLMASMGTLSETFRLAAVRPVTAKGPGNVSRPSIHVRNIPLFAGIFYM